MKSRVTRRSAANTTTTVIGDGESLPLQVDNNPPVLTILPKGVSQAARIVTLPNPATSTRCRYLLCPELGPFEFTTVAAGKAQPGSWLLAPTRTTEGESTESGAQTAATEQGYCVQKPDLHLATPVDPIFLLLPDLAAENGGQRMFLSLDDHVDAWAQRTNVKAQLLLCEHTTHSLSQRLAAVCDMVNAGDEKMYKLSEVRLAQEILAMAQRVAKAGLPASMEDRLIQESLKNPAMSFVAEEGNADNESTGADEHVQRLLRLRTAADFILDSYVEPTLRHAVSVHFKGPDSVIDFAPLDARLAQLETLRTEAQALRSISDNISRKRSHVDDEAEAIRAEKRRKKEEEETKKKSQSRAVKQLAKVNTSGMKKMSSFFAKKT